MMEKDVFMSFMKQNAKKYNVSSFSGMNICCFFLFFTLLFLGPELLIPIHKQNKTFHNKALTPSTTDSHNKRLNKLNLNVMKTSCYWYWSYRFLLLFFERWIICLSQSGEHRLVSSSKRHAIRCRWCHRPHETGGSLCH